MRIELVGGLHDGDRHEVADDVTEFGVREYRPLTRIRPGDAYRMFEDRTYRLSTTRARDGVVQFLLAPPEPLTD